MRWLAVVLAVVAVALVAALSPGLVAVEVAGWLVAVHEAE